MNICGRRNRQGALPQRQDWKEAEDGDADNHCHWHTTPPLGLEAAECRPIFVQHSECSDYSEESVVHICFDILYFIQTFIDKHCNTKHGNQTSTNFCSFNSFMFSNVRKIDK